MHSAAGRETGAEELLGALVAALGGGLLATLRGSARPPRAVLALLADLRDLFLELLRLLDLGRRGDRRDDRLLGVVEELDSGGRRRPPTAPSSRRCPSPDTSATMRSGMSVGSALTFSSRVTCSSTPPSLTPGASSTPSISSATIDSIFSSRRTFSRSRCSTCSAHRVAVLVLDDHGLAVAAVDLDVEQRVALGEHPAQAAGVDLERDASPSRSRRSRRARGPRGAAAGWPASRAPRAGRASAGFSRRPPSAADSSGARRRRAPSLACRAMADDRSDRSIPKSRLGPLRDARHAGGGRGRAVRRRQGHGRRALEGPAARADGRDRAGVGRAAGRHARHDEGRRDEDGAARLLHRHRLPARGVPRAVPGEARRRCAPPLPRCPGRRCAGCSTQEFDEPYEELFERIEPEAFAAASIGQVHRGTLHDGREVAVKIQYPGIDSAIRADLSNAGMILRLTKALAPGLDAKAVADELRERVLEELDYEHEAQNQRSFARAYRGHPFIRVPDVVTRLSRSRVLVTEYVQGIGFEDVKQMGAEERNRFARDRVPLLPRVDLPAAPLQRRRAPRQLPADRSTARSRSSTSG